MSESDDHRRRPKLLAEFLQGSVIIAAGAIIGGVLEYLTRLGIARYLGPERFGLFSIGYSLFVILGAVAAGGTDASVARAVSSFIADSDLSRAKGTVLYGAGLVTILGLTCAVSLTWLAPTLAVNVWHEPRLPSILLRFAWLLPIFALNHVVLATLRGLRAMARLAFVRDVAERCGRAVALVVTMLAGAQIEGVIGTYYIGFVISFLIGLALLYFLVRDWFFRTESAFEFSQLWHYTWPITIADLLNALRSTGEFLLLAYFVSAAGVGAYSAAKILLLFFQMPLLIFAPMFLPAIAQALTRGHLSDAKCLYLAEARWFFIYGLVLYLFVLLLPDLIISTPFGQGFDQIGLVFRILGAGAFVNLITANCGEFLLAAGESRALASIRGISFTVGTVLSLRLMPRYGELGAAVAASISLAIESSLQVVYLYRYWQIHPFSRFHFLYFMMCTAIFLGLWSASRWFDAAGPWWIFGGGILACILSIVLVPIVIGVHIDDRSLLRIMAGRIKTIIHFESEQVEQ